MVTDRKKRLLRGQWNVPEKTEMLQIVFPYLKRAPRCPWEIKGGGKKMQ